MLGRMLSRLSRARSINIFKLNEFKGKVFEQSTLFYATGFNDGLRKARKSPTAPLNILWAIEYDSDCEEVQYDPDECALPKVHPPPP